MSTVIINKGYSKTKTTILVVGSGANTVNLTDLVANNGGPNDTVSAFNISRIFYSTANTTAGISIARGANTLLVLTGSGDWFLDGCAIDAYSNSSLVVTMPDAVSSCYLEVHKRP